MNENRRCSILYHLLVPGGDHKAFCFWITFPSDCPPPSADRIDRKTGGVVIRADADPSDVVGDVVDTIGHRTPQFGINKIVDIDEFRTSLSPPFPAAVLEIAHQLVTRPGESRPQPLSERGVKLSLRTAPIRRALRSCRVASVRTDQRGF
jgi:hypothetical protein